MANEFSTRDYATPRDFSSPTLLQYRPVAEAPYKSPHERAVIAAAQSRQRFGSTGDPENKTPASDLVLDPVARSKKYYFKMRFYDYTKPMATYAQKPLSNMGQLTKEIRLPLPQSLYDQTNVAYDPAALQLLGDLDFSGFAKGGAEMQSQFTKLIGDAISSGGNRVAMQMIPGLLQETFGAVPGLGDIAAALQQSLGATVNPNEALTLQGPGLRPWSFRWVFLPHTSDESTQIQKLIQELKARSLPFVAKGTGNTTQQSGMLGYPQICMINTYPWDDPMKQNADTTVFGWTESSIMKIKRTMLAGVNVSYNSQGTPAFFRGTNNPVSIELALTFKEIEYFLSEDEVYTTYDIPTRETPVSNIESNFEAIANQHAGIVEDYVTMMSGAFSPPRS